VAKLFRINIRNYNNVLAFTSLGVKIDHSVYGPGEVYTFRIQRELCHRIEYLLPAHADEPAFAQIYIFNADPQQQADVRMSHHVDLLDRPTLLALQDMILRYNPYFKVFKTARERLTEHYNITLHLKTIDVPHLDQRRYNRPMASEIAVVMVGSGEESTSGKRDIVIQSRDGPLRRVSELHSSYCPLRYPMLFPYGEQGWHLNMSHLWKYLRSEGAFADR